METYPPDKEALLSESLGNLILVAPPGCGKTEALALRAKGLLDNGVVTAPRRILALAFSNRARDNMSDRLRRLLGEASFLRYMAVANFHGFATRVYKAHAASMDLAPDAQLPEKGWLGNTLRSLGATNKVARDAENLIREVKLRPLSDDEVLQELVSADCDFAVEAERIRVAESRLDFPDLLRHAQRLLQNPVIAKLYQLHFGAVLVDEFQDLTEQQLDIVLAVSQDNITFAGDPSQAIYSFAGADVETVSRRINNLKETRTIEFTHSFRSSPAVLRLVNSISDTPGAPELKSATPEKWPEGGVVSCHAFIDEQEEANYIVELAERIMKSDPQATIGVISRVNYRRSTIDERTKSLTTFSVRHWDNPAYSPDVIRLLRLELRKVANVKGLDENERLQLLEEGCLASVEPTDVDLFEDTRQAFSFLRDVVSRGLGVQQAVESLRVSDEAVSVGPGLHLLNAHVGKGQQFDWVVMVGLEEGLIPDFRARTAKDLGEERRTLLVMASRARHGVFATRVNFTSGLYGPRPAAKSRWWDLVAHCSTCTPDAAFDAVHNSLSAKASSESTAL